jgi:predicted GNAT family acetyltransferase
MDLEVTAAAVVDLWRQLGIRAPGAWLREEPGALAVVSGIPVATLNGVWVHGPQASPAAVSELLADVAARATPFSLQARPASVEAAEEAALAHGMAAQEPIPLMVVEDPAAIAGDLVAGDLVVREATSAERPVHVQVAAAGFECPVPLYEDMMRATDVIPGQRCWLGFVDGVAVTTALTIPTGGGTTGVVNVATPPQHRGHGFGAAVTAAATRAALAEGACLVWLQSSPPGRGVYANVGFRVLEEWPFWTSADAG